MTEKELKYYYPYRFFNSRKHLGKIIDKIETREDIEKHLEILASANHRESQMEPDRWFDQNRLNLRAVTEMENIYSFAKFRHNGSNIFNFSRELLQLLDKTDVEDIQFQNIRHPFKEYYISFRNLDRDILGEYMEFEYKLDGVYISNEIDNAIILHITGFNENKKVKNWWYYPDFTNINTLDFVKPENTVKDALSNLYSNLNQRVPEAEGDLIPNLDRTFKEIERNIKLIINCILFLSTQEEDLTKEYPTDIPSRLTSKLSKAKTKHQREVAKAEINRNGFSKITFAKLHKSERIESGIGSEVSPHWRRGHWRKQPFGHNLSEIKLIWIKPTIVRKDKGKPTKGHIYEVEE